MVFFIIGLDQLREKVGNDEIPYVILYEQKGNELDGETRDMRRGEEK